MTKFITGLVESLFLFLEFPIRPTIRVHLIAAKADRPIKPVAKCDGCIDIVTAHIDRRLPPRCPVCKRPTREIERELFFVNYKQESN